MKPKPLTSIALVLAAALARAQVPSCESIPRVFETWMRLRDSSGGIAGTDDRPFLDPTLVPFPGRPPSQSCPNEVDFSSDQEGRASDGIHPWVAASPCKITACGTPLSFEENRGLALISGEYDLNNNISLDDGARQRLDRYSCFPKTEKAKQKPTRLAFQEPRLCFPDTEYLHVEITPPRRLRPLLASMWTGDGGYEWFRWRNLLHDGEMCAYGPFVADLAHAAKAEIHPAQLLWWNERPSTSGAKREAFAPDGPWALFLLQDASNRYSQRHHFILKDRPPAGSGWAPWAAGPVTGVFEVAFFVGREETNPPLFELRPYEYNELRAGSPGYSPCPQEHVAALEIATGTGDVRTIARVCDSTRIRPPAHVRIEGQVLCECTPPGAADEPTPPRVACPKAGYLARLTVRAEAGNDREWREGGFALLLTDSRAKERNRARHAEEAEAPADPRAHAAWEPQLTWRAAGPWERVEPDAAGTITNIGRWLFEQAGWPIGDVPPPMPSLWRLDKVTLNLDVNLDLPEQRKREKKVVADWRRAQVSESSSASAITELRIVEDGDHRAHLSLAKLPPLAAHRIQVTAGASKVGPLPQRLRVETPVTREAAQRAEKAEARAAASTATVDPQDFVLWSHGLGALPAKDWSDAARDLCTHFSTSEAQGRLGAAGPAEPSGGQEPSGAADGGLLQTDLRVVVDRTLKDGVVSTTELSLLVQDVERLCRPATRAGPPRPVLLQAK